MVLTNSIWEGNRFLGIDWDVWKIIGWLGNAVFFSRFFVQWIATEKRKKVIVPISFWWLSLVGSLLLLIYGIHQQDSVFIFAYAFTWIPYIRNILIHHKNQSLKKSCAHCGEDVVACGRFCHHCGVELSKLAVSDG